MPSEGARETLIKRLEDVSNRFQLTREERDHFAHAIKLLHRYNMRKLPEDQIATLEQLKGKLFDPDQERTEHTRAVQATLEKFKSLLLTREEAASKVRTMTIKNPDGTSRPLAPEEIKEMLTRERSFDQLRSTARIRKGLLRPRRRLR